MRCLVPSRQWQDEGGGYRHTVGEKAGMILVTGAAGHIGRAVCALLGDCAAPVLPLDFSLETLPPNGVCCDIRRQQEVQQLFDSYAIQSVIHAAAVLPTAFRTDPIAGADVNLNGSIHLLQQAVRVGVRRFVLVSSMSVYGSASRNRPLTEEDAAIPDEPYGGSKRSVELVGEALRSANGLEFISLRVARVIGPGARSTSSTWRSQIFGDPHNMHSVRIPFAPSAVLSLVHVEDVARMLAILIHSTRAKHSVYNTPVELWKAGELQSLVEKHVGVDVQLGHIETGGPACDGTRFALEFNFRIRGLEDRLSKRGEGSRSQDI